MRSQLCLKPQNFYDVYLWTICAKLRKIDVFLKTNKSISVLNTARLLEITDSEVSAVMQEEHINRITPGNFFKIMLRGSSDICHYVQRETELCSPLTYTMDEIAYIYGLDIEDVHKASDITGIHEATALTLPCLFYHIPAR